MENCTSRSRSDPTVPQPEALGLPDGNLEATERLQENHPIRHQSEESLVSPKGSHGPYSSGELNKNPKLPWWKTPSPWW